MIDIEYICEKYQDRDLWLVAADQYHDEGLLGVEAALRWFVRHRKEPYLLPHDVWLGLDKWVWFNPGHGGPSYYEVRRHLNEHAPKTCKLPACLMAGDYFNIYQQASNAVWYVFDRYVALWEAIQ